MGDEQKPAMIKVRCPNPNCRKILAVKVELAGKKGRCPLCKQAMSIPPLLGAESAQPPPPAYTRGQTVTLTAPPEPAGEEAASVPTAPAFPSSPEPQAPAAPSPPPSGPRPPALEIPHPSSQEPSDLPSPKGGEALPGWLAKEDELPPPPPPRRKRTPLPRHTALAPSTRGPGGPTAMEILTGAVPPGPGASVGQPAPPAPPAAAPPPAATRDAPPPAAEGRAEREAVREAEEPTGAGPAAAPSGAPPRAPTPSPGIVPVESVEEPGEPKRRGEPTGRAAASSRERGRASYELAGGVLTVSGTVGYDLDPEFAEYCRRLLASPQADLLIDLSDVAYLSSTYLGVLAPLFPDATDAGKRLSLRVQGKVARVLRIAGFERLGKIIVTDA